MGGGAPERAAARSGALEPGDEAIVDTAEFTLDGRAMRTVRQVHDPVERAGRTVRVRRHADIPGAEMTRLLQRADGRRDEAAQRGFGMASGGSAIRVTDSAVMRSARTGRASYGHRCPSSPGGRADSRPTSCGGTAMPRTG
ncbi:hypothetical protein IQ62_13590 [Streptomyces scabiei]|nr:hypothetical protein IQ62_13590 [Streptomyces scabiei]